MSHSTIETLLKKAAASENPDGAMKYTQGALNAANALSVLAHMPNKQQPKTTA
jgi:hypothetical protein